MFHFLLPLFVCFLLVLLLSCVPIVNHSMYFSLCFLLTRCLFGRCVSHVPRVLLVST